MSDYLETWTIKFDMLSLMLKDMVAQAKGSTEESGLQLLLTKNSRNKPGKYFDVIDRHNLYCVRL